MAKLKSLTDEAMRHRREAYVERQCKPHPVLAPVWDRAADKAVTLPTPPDVGLGGEVVDVHPPPEGTKQEVSSEARWKRQEIRNTLGEGATRIAEGASIQRMDPLLQPNLDAVAMAIDAAYSIEAASSIDKMLAHQLAVAHEMALRMANRGPGYMTRQSAAKNVEAVRGAPTRQRLMAALKDAVLTGQRLRTGGSQTVTVQHVTVAQGGQAVIGNVNAGGAERRRRKRNGG